MYNSKRPHRRLRRLRNGGRNSIHQGLSWRLKNFSYIFSASGLPKDRIYRFWAWELGRDPQLGLDGTIDYDGTIMLKPSSKENTNPGPNVFGVPAEPKRFALVSLDGESRAFGQIVPFPIESSDGTCKLSVEMLEPLYALVALRAEGLKLNENLQVTLESGRGGGRLKPKADEQGRWSASVGPYVKGKKEGLTQVELTATSCKVKITFPWGL